MRPFRAEGKIRYNPKVPKRQLREMPEERWRDLFAALRSNRDRAILAFAVSNGARAGELLGIRLCDLDWGDQLVRVVRKGTQAEQWLPASPDAFVWFRFYLAELGDPLKPDERVWQTLRRRDHGGGMQRQPLEYDALRAVFRRVNALLGSNWSMHDLRHTAALRMARDRASDVEGCSGDPRPCAPVHTEVYLVQDQVEVIRRVQKHLAEQETRAAQQPARLSPPDTTLTLLTYCSADSLTTASHAGGRGLARPAKASFAHRFERHHELLGADGGRSDKDGWAVNEILELFPSLPSWPSTDGSGRRSRLVNAARRILEWLGTHPGQGWQDRWLASGADEGRGWIDGVIVAGGKASTKTQRAELVSGMGSLLLCRVMLPSYHFLATYQAAKLYCYTQQVFRPDLFANLQAHGSDMDTRGRQLSTPSP